MHLVLAGCFFSCCVLTAYAYLIEPGMGLIQQTPQSSQSSFRRSPQPRLEIVVFEHTDVAGTGGLVLNCPTPLQLGNIAIPRFRAFEKLPLMLGCGSGGGGGDFVTATDEDDSGDDYEDPLSSASSIPLGDLSPWFWLHNMDDLSGSFPLEAAAGPLYMGGNIEEATERIQRDNIDPAGRFKFFRKYKSWKAGQLEQELEEGLWKLVPQDPTKALQAIRSSVPPVSTSLS